MPSANSAHIFDCIIVGSGAGGAAAAYKLAMSGLRVVLLEKGDDLPRDGSTLDVERVVKQGAFASKEPWRDGRGRAFAPEEHFNLGGKTKWYGAALLRFSRREFGADPEHQCLAWPFGYDELAPYYDEAEQLLDVRTFPVEPDLARIVSDLELDSPQWRTETLQMGLSAGIARSAWEATHFDGFASIADLKSDAETSFISRIRTRRNVVVRTGAEVVELLGDESNPLRIVGVQLASGERVFAGNVLLAAGALHSPRLLQRYLARTPAASGLPINNVVGRNLKLHLLTAVLALSPTRKTDLLRKTALLVNDTYPHSSVQPLGFDGELLAALVPSFVPASLRRLIGSRAYGFFLQTEDGSNPANRVADGVSPVMDYDPGRVAPAALEHGRFVTAFRQSLSRIGMVAFSRRIGLAGTAHVCGTLVAGNEPSVCAVDINGAIHGLRSLYVVDGSVLPRSSRVNPSLTIYAWSLRVAEKLAASVRGPASQSLLMEVEA